MQWQPKTLSDVYEALRKQHQISQENVDQTGWENSNRQLTILQNQRRSANTKSSENVMDNVNGVIPNPNAFGKLFQQLTAPITGGLSIPKPSQAVEPIKQNSTSQLSLKQSALANLSLDAGLPGLFTNNLQNLFGALPFLPQN